MCLERVGGPLALTKVTLPRVQGPLHQLEITARETQEGGTRPLNRNMIEEMTELRTRGDNMTHVRTGGTRCGEGLMDNESIRTKRTNTSNGNPATRAGANDNAA